MDVGLRLRGVFHGLPALHRQQAVPVCLQDRGRGVGADDRHEVEQAIAPRVEVSPEFLGEEVAFKDEGVGLARPDAGEAFEEVGKRSHGSG